jgi:hypothetical protein
MDRQPHRGAQKKLTDAALHWLRGGVSYNDAISDLKAFGAPQDVIDELIEAQKNEDFEVWDENWPVLTMFFRMQTQWRTSHSGLVGLDYSAAQWIFGLYSVEDQREMLEALQVMEFAILSAKSEETE